MFIILKRLWRSRSAPAVVTALPETIATLDQSTVSEENNIANQALLVSEGVPFERAWAGSSPWGRKDAVLFSHGGSYFLFENDEVVFHHKGEN